MPMSAIERQLPFLYSIFEEADANRREERLNHASRDQINAVSELALNTSNENNPLSLSPELIERTRPFKDPIMKLQAKSKSIKERRALLKAQSGGFFDALKHVGRHIAVSDARARRHGQDHQRRHGASTRADGHEKSVTFKRPRPVQKTRGSTQTESSARR